MDSILDTIKKLLGIDVSDTSFDTDVTIGINSAIFILSQIGIGPSDGFIVTTKDNKWTDYLDGSVKNLESVKNYIYLKTKIVFDPPTSPTVIQAINESIDEMEYRLRLAVETNNLEV